MIVLVVHNSYAKPSGEETAVANTVQLLSSSGHRVVVYTKGSQDISSIPMGRAGHSFPVSTASRPGGNLQDCCFEQGQISYTYTTCFLLYLRPYYPYASR